MNNLNPLLAIISKLKTIYAPGEVAVTASTGIAAANIKGTTIHRQVECYYTWRESFLIFSVMHYSFAKVGLGNSSLDYYLDKYSKNRNYSASLRKVRVLIVDEISMLDGGLLDIIESICRMVRGNRSKPFGGIKVRYV